MTTKTMTPAELAVELESDGRTVRKFLRSSIPKDQHPGKGSRWAIPATAKDLTKLRKAFDTWTAAAEAKKAEKVEEPTPEVPEIDDKVELDD